MRIELENKVKDWEENIKYSPKCGRQKDFESVESSFIWNASENDWFLLTIQPFS